MSVPDKRQQLWPPFSACRWTTVVTLLMTVCTSTVDGQENDLVHVVNIRVNRVDEIEDPCPVKCTGTLVTSTMVLTAASCTEFDIVEITKMTSMAPQSHTPALNSAKKIRISNKRKYKTEEPGMAVENGSIRVYLSLPNSKFQRNVTRKFVNPEWNSKTKVADLVLLKLSSNFQDYFKTKMHNVVENNMTNLPVMVQFKGFGKINLTLYSEQPIDDIEGNRILHINFNNKMCPSVNNGTVSENDLNWWSFLCTTGEHTRNNSNVTLCDEDIGGPLYILEDSLPRLVGVFSHAYHVKYPMCATKLCYVQETAPYPCDTERGQLYYKHTALIGRYAYWMNHTVETERRLVTTPPTCPTEPTVFNVLTSVDPEYDVDVYSDRRVMVGNYKVCPKHRASSATVAATASAPVAAVAVLAIRSCWTA